MTPASGLAILTLTAGFDMPFAAFWLLVAIVAAIGEMVGTGLFLASIAVAAVITAVLALLIPSLVLESVVFVVLALVGIAVFRPFVVHALGLDAAPQLTGAVGHSHMHGKRGIVTQTVNADGGQIRVGEGEFWSARPYNESERYETGTPVDILYVDGVTALVEQPQEASALPDDLEAGAKPIER